MAFYASMRFRTAAIIVASFILSHAAGLLFYALDRRDTLAVTEAVDRAERAADISRLLHEVPADWHDSIISFSDSRNLRVWLSDKPAVVVPEPTRTERDIAAYLRTQVPRIAEGDLRVRFIEAEEYPITPPPFDPSGRAGSPAYARNDPDKGSALTISMRHDDRQWINFIGLLGPQRVSLPSLFLANIISSAIAIALVAFWLVRRVTQPLARLSEASERLGRNLFSAPLPVSGPSEVVLAATAFNKMQRRLIRLIRGRTEFLAAISHDLRTPVTQIRLRTEMMPASPERDKNLRALDDIDAIIGTFLHYARTTDDAEVKSRIDLGALVASICDDLSDSGAMIDCDCASGVILSCKRVGIKRAVTNLIENALKYGQKARVSIQATPHAVIISVEDRGPGIPASELEGVFLPFNRGDKARSAGSGGIGLGLSIAQAIAEDHGGEVRLSNRSQGGLCAQLVLPL
ncbi:ATP-binding protein [Paracoccus sp. WLY502]|uniref:ATP-binding protein n=1 Tax=Paracoccus yibinensis TaxID=3068891 RepID=UPI002796BEC7|nr:ATP-binding protein [Paracoccus sp. WLY502]MDQ1900238.1 ATP-binding protein [Paracoccus sp. WLY502]